MEIYRYDLGVIGCGNMAGAIIRGLKSSGSDLRIAATDLDAERVRSVGADYVGTNRELAEQSRYLLFAVKPFHAQDVFAEIAPVLTGDQCVVSIMAGVTVATLTAHIPTVKRFVRVMPNLAARCGCAMSVVMAGESATDEDMEIVTRIFRSVGEIAIMPEAKVDAVISVSGSGTAYVYEFIKHMIDGGVKNGLTYDESKQLTLQTLRGAVKMTEQAEDGALDGMIDAVCSKGGTTIEAVKTLRGRGFGGILEDAMRACYDRSVEMSKE